MGVSGAAPDAKTDALRGDCVCEIKDGRGVENEEMEFLARRVTDDMSAEASSLAR